MTDLKQVLFIINRYAGKNRIVGRLTDLLDHFSQKGYLPTVHITRHSGDATQVARALGGDFPLVVCSGGDGTLSEVVAGLMQLPEERRPAVGYIPAGSTNDFAITLGLPFDMNRCAAIVTEGKRQKLDVGKFGDDRTFVYVAAFGTFTETSYATPQREKNLLGHNAYILHGLKELTNLRSYAMHVTVDGTLYEGDFLFGMVSNANSVGGLRQPMGVEAVLDDGMMEVLLIRAPESAAEWPQLLTEILGKKSDGRYLITSRAKQVVFDCQQSIAWVLDGEHGGAHQNVTIEAMRQAISFVLPSEGAAMD